MADTTPASPQELERILRGTGYLPDEGLATVAWLAMRMRRPLLLEGEPGTGKTSLADALAEATGARLIRLQCYEGIDASQALYDWDFPRQVLHLRAIEAASSGAGSVDLESIEQDLFTERFLLDRPVLQALRTHPAVLLVDEIDRADDEFEAFLLEVLSTWSVSIPELGTVRAEHPPLVVLTSNRTREVHDALKRRCLYHWLEHPGLAREVEILRTRLPELPARLAEQVVAAVHRLQERLGRLRRDPQPRGPQRAHETGQGDVHPRRRLLVGPRDPVPRPRRPGRLRPGLRGMVRGAAGTTRPADAGPAAARGRVAGPDAVRTRRRAGPGTSPGRRQWDGGAAAP